jgi:hypothetical protein
MIMIIASDEISCSIHLDELSGKFAMDTPNIAPAITVPIKAVILSLRDLPSIGQYYQTTMDKSTKIKLNLLHPWLTGTYSESGVTAQLGFKHPDSGSWCQASALGNTPICVVQVTIA